MPAKLITAVAYRPTVRPEVWMPIFIFPNIVMNTGEMLARPHETPMRIELTVPAAFGTSLWPITRLAGNEQKDISPIRAKSQSECRLPCDPEYMKITSNRKVPAAESIISRRKFIFLK